MAGSLAAWSVPSCSRASWRMFCGGFCNSRRVSLNAESLLAGLVSSHVKSSQSPISLGYRTNLKKRHQRPRGGYALGGNLLGGSGSFMKLEVGSRSPKPDACIGQDRANNGVDESRRGHEAESSTDAPSVSAPSVGLGGGVATDRGAGGAEHHTSEASGAVSGLPARCDCGAKDSPRADATHCWWCGKAFPN